MTKTFIQAYNIANEHRMRITVTLMAGCLVLAMLYGINIYHLVLRTVAMQETQSALVAKSHEVNSLASKYLTLSSALTPDTLSNYGLNAANVSQYISRTSSLSRVAMSGHEL